MKPPIMQIVSGARRLQDLQGRIQDVGIVGEDKLVDGGIDADDMWFEYGQSALASISR